MSIVAEFNVPGNVLSGVFAPLSIDEQITYLRAGIDGLFTDQADISVIARAAVRD